MHSIIVISIIFFMGYGLYKYLEEAHTKYLGKKNFKITLKSGVIKEIRDMNNIIINDKTVSFKENDIFYVILKDDISEINTELELIKIGRI